MASKVLRTLVLPASWEQTTSLLCHYTRQYGAQIFILTVLSAITIFRREISCNHIYAEESDRRKPPASADDSDDDRDLIDWDESQAEELLERAGLYCSGASLVGALTLWLNFLDAATVDQDVGEGVIVAPQNSKNMTELAMPLMELDPAVADDLLEHVGNYGTGESVVSAALSVLVAWGCSETPQRTTQLALARTIRRNLLQECTPPPPPCHEEAPFFTMLPHDSHANILSFLHPRDVVTLARVSRSCRALVEEPGSSAAIWKILWQRDYGWIVQSWDVGREALQRSCALESVQFSKEFYFLFGLSYLNYVLAGQNTTDRCLVGLHGNIFDITPFLLAHPGSPDTVMVHAGRDATEFFEDMRHSMGARRIAMSLCVVVDAATLVGNEDSSSNNNGYCGLYPTLQTKGTCPLPRPVIENQPPVSIDRNRQARGATLQLLRTNYNASLQQHQKWVDQQYANNPNVLSHVNVYYDPMDQRWKAWYTDSYFETVFVQDIGPRR